MKKLVIERNLIVKNLTALKNRAGAARIYAVLTGNAHGAGLVETAEVLADHGVTRFAVSDAKDAERLRKAGFVEQEVLFLRSTCDEEELERLMDLNVICTIGSSEAGMALNALAQKRSTVAEAHVQVDSGMGYGGFIAAEPDKILNAFRNLQHVAISGIYTQFQSASASEKQVAQQLEEFHQAVKFVQDAGCETGTVHAAGSFSTIHYDFSRMDGVRIGSALFGRCKRKRGDGLTKVGFCEASVEEIRWLPKGHTVGYEAPVRLRKPTRVATVAVGYQDGISITPPRKLTLRETLRRWLGKEQPTARVNGQKARIIGRVGAMETLIDVTELKCKVGDVAQLEIDPMYARGMEREWRG